MTGNDAGTGRMGTRSSNSSKHPGLVTKTTTRRSSADVKAAAKVKEDGKKAKKEGQDARIQHVADFESSAKTAEELADATPRPKFATRGTHDDAEISDGQSLAPPGDSDDNEMHVPNLKKRKRIPTRKTKDLATIAEDSGDEDDIIFFTGPIDAPKRIILEETDTDGDGPPLRNWKPKAKRGFSDDDEPAVAEEKAIPPPSKKARQTMTSNDEERQMEKPQPKTSKKKKPSVREAVAAIQQAKSGETSKDTGRRGDERAEESHGQAEEKEDDKGQFKRPNQNKDQIGLPGDAT
jgi:hypothetical protein